MSFPLNKNNSNTAAINKSQNKTKKPLHYVYFLHRCAMFAA